MGIFHDSPEETPPERCRSEIGIRVYGEVEPGDDVRVREIPAMEVASISHAGPAKDYQETYRVPSEWIAGRGYEWVGPSIEVYTKKPEVIGGERVVYAKVMAPIRRR